MFRALVRQRVARPGEINHSAVDRYTVGHGAFGILMGLARFPWWAALTVAIGWEFLEHPIKDHFPKAFPYATQDTFANSTFDALAMMAGWTAIKALPAAPLPLDGHLVARRRVVR